jgi:uncharacterized protein YecE (DUF72 family)
MEFGSVTQEDLDRIDFRLPPDHPETDRILRKAERKPSTPGIFVGCAKWGRKDWLGKIYPDKTKEADFLEHYARHFNCIELNATFYKIPNKTQTAAWRKKVGPDFLFCPKVSQSITHIRRLKNAKELIDRFIDGISGFGENLGPIFLMPHPQMGPKSLSTIEEFLESVPRDINVFMELRHPEWFSDQAAYNSVCAAMEKRNAGAVITDVLGRRDCVHMRLTSPEVFIRFVGNDLHPTDYKRVDEWIERIRSWKEKGISKVYFFMHQHEEVHSPEMCRYVIRQLNERCGTAIPEPVFVT